MTDRARKTVALAAIGVAALSFDLLAVFGMAPLARDAMGSDRSQALLKAGGSVVHAVAVATRERLSRVAGSALIGVAKENTRIFAAMLSLTPREHVGHLRVVKCRAILHCGRTTFQCPPAAAQDWPNSIATGGARCTASLQRAL